MKLSDTIFALSQYFGVACCVNGLVAIWFPVLDDGLGCRRPKRRTNEDDAARDDGGYGGKQSLYSQLLAVEDAEASQVGVKPPSPFRDVWPYRLHVCALPCGCIANSFLGYACHCAFPWFVLRSSCSWRAS